MQSEELYDILDNKKYDHIPVVLTATEVMDILGVGKNTLYRLLNSGSLCGIKIGRSWRITGSALEFFLLKNGVAS